jgi:hypothetical protein
MTPSSDPEATMAYTRASVETYLRAAAAEKTRLQRAIEHAQQRTARARSDAEALTNRNADSSEMADESDEAADAEDDHSLVQLPLRLSHDVELSYDHDLVHPALVNE